MTAAVAIIFMLTSITLTYTASRKTSGLMDKVSTPVTRQTIPAAPIPAAPGTAPGAANTPATPAAK
jgi:preprotein translocase subunit SecG